MTTDYDVTFPHTQLAYTGTLKVRGTRDELSELLLFMESSDLYQFRDSTIFRETLKELRELITVLTEYEKEK